MHVGLLPAGPSVWSRARILVVLGAVTVISSGCAEGATGPDGWGAPSILHSAIRPNEHNVLSTVVSVGVEGADSVAVLFRLADGPSPGVLNLSAAVQVRSDSLELPVLGLLSGTRYVMRVVAWGGTRSRVGPALEITTGLLPTDLPAFRGEGTESAPGYVVFAADSYGIVIDNTGRVVWYRRFPEGPGLTFTAQPNGRYYARPSTSAVGDTEPWLELDPMGNLVRTITCADGLRPRFHDLIAQADGTFWLLCDERRTMDLSATGGVASAQVTGTAVQRVRGDGSLLFSWSPFDHFQITDVHESERSGPTVNWTHGNALELDLDGNLLVSFRNLNEITKIDTGSGAVVWRLGGLANQFLFVDTEMPPFSRQHSVRIDDEGVMLVLDNSGDATQSRAEHFLVDSGGRTARLTRSFASTPSVITPFGGSVQDLGGGRTLVSFGMAGRVEEYDAEGRSVWSLEGNAGYVFRAQRIKSLYAPGVGSGR